MPPEAENACWGSVKNLIPGLKETIAAKMNHLSMTYVSPKLDRNK